MEAKKVNAEKHEQIVSAKVLDYVWSGKCGDIVLVSKIDGRRMWAHRMVLSACSEYFKEIFMNMEATREELQLEIEGKVLRALMLYCYFGEICELEQIAPGLMVAAAQYLIQPVVDVCALYLADLEKSNCLQKMLLAERYNLRDLLGNAKAFVCQNFTKVSKTREFLHMPFEHLRSIVASDELQVTCEEEVLNCVLSWVQHDWSNRQAHLLSLMKWIRLSLLPSTFIKEKIRELDGGCGELGNLMEQHLGMERTISQLGLPEVPRKGSSAILIVQHTIINRKMFHGLRSFSPHSGKMKEWSNLPDARYNFSVALLGRNLIIAGGLSRDVKALNTAYMQNLETKMWTPLHPLKMNCRCFSLVALNEFVYAIGGLFDSPKTVERLDPSNLDNTWECVAPMSCGRLSPAAVVLKERLYVAGGCNTKSVECYDPKTNVWSERAPMNNVRMRCMAVAGKGYLYVLGGDLHSQTVHTVERYDPQANKWIKLCSLSAGRRYLAAAISGNRIFATSVGSDYSKSLFEEYNIGTDKWKLLGCYGCIPYIITVPKFYGLNST